MSSKQNEEKVAPETDIDTLIDALGILARNVLTDDGVANACIAEAAIRLLSMKYRIKLAAATIAHQAAEIERLQKQLAEQEQDPDDTLHPPPMKIVGTVLVKPGEIRPAPVMPIDWGEDSDCECDALRERVAELEAKIERYQDALEYTKEHLDSTLKNFADSLADGRTERCPACGCPTLKKSLQTCCDFHGSVCEDCWGDCEHES